MPEPETTNSTSKPDHFFVNNTTNRVESDRGPRYKETPLDPLAPNAPTIAEPWNAVTASFFISIVFHWLWRIRGRYRKFPFLMSCMPILLVGGVGGTLYHAFRTRFVYFLMDVIPISLLGLAGSVYLAVRLGYRFGTRRILLITLGVLAMYLFLNGFLFRFIRSDYPTLAVNLSYASLAIIIIIPMLATMIQTRFRYAGFVWAGLASFAVAWFCRLVDPFSPLPMGTHWLWHTFGAITTVFIVEYFYRVESKQVYIVRQENAEDADKTQTTQ